MQSTGATIKQLQGAYNSNKNFMCGLHIVWSDYSEETIGSMTAGGCTRSGYLQFDSGEFTGSLREQGDGGNLCKLTIAKTRTGADLGDYFELGIPGECGGDQKGSTYASGELESGIIIGFFGYASSSGKIYQLGVVMLQKIVAVSTGTDGINYGSEVPMNQQIYTRTLDATSGIDDSQSVNYFYYSGEYSYYSESTVRTSYFGIGATLNLFYTKTKPTAEYGGDITVDTKYEFTKSTE